MVLYLKICLIFPQCPELKKRCFFLTNILWFSSLIQLLFLLVFILLKCISVDFDDIPVTTTISSSSALCLHGIIWVLVCVKFQTNTLRVVTNKELIDFPVFLKCWSLFKVLGSALTLNVFPCTNFLKWWMEATSAKGSLRMTQFFPDFESDLLK